MKDCRNELASMIPATPPRQGAPESTPLLAPGRREGFRRYGVLHRDIALGAFEQWTKVDCDWLRATSAYPFVMETKDVGQTFEEAYMYPRATGVVMNQGSFMPELQPGVGGGQVASGDPILFAPSFDVVVDRPTESIRFPQPRNAVDLDYAKDQLPNAVVHLFLGRGRLRETEWGRPSPHSIQIAVPDTGASTAWFSNAIRPTLSGDNLGTNASRNGWVPLRTEITGFSWNLSFGGVGNGVIFVSVIHFQSGGTWHQMGTWYPPILPVGDYDLAIPIEFSPLQCRLHDALNPSAGAIGVFLGMSLGTDGGNFNLRFRSYL